MHKIHIPENYLVLTETVINSFGNLFIGLLLAKYLNIEEYATFGNLWLFYFFVWGVFSAYFLTPLASKENDFRSGITKLNMSFLKKMSVFFIIFNLVFMFFFEISWKTLIFSWIFFGFLFDYERRRLIVDGEIKYLIFVSLLGLFLKLIITFMLSLSIENVLIVFIIPSIICCSLTCFYGVQKIEKHFKKEDYIDYKKYTGSLLFGNVMSWFGVNGFLVLAGVILPANQFSVLRFYQSLFSAMGIIGQAVESFYYPKISNAAKYSKKNASKIAIKGFNSIFLIFLILGVFFVFFADYLFIYFKFNENYFVVNNTVLITLYIVSSVFFVGVVFQRVYMRSIGLYGLASLTSIIPIMVLIVFYFMSFSKLENYHFAMMTMFSMLSIFLVQYYLILMKQKVNL